MNVCVIRSAVFRHTVEVDIYDLILIEMFLIVFILRDSELVKDERSVCSFFEKCADHICHDCFAEPTGPGDTEILLSIQSHCLKELFDQFRFVNKKSGSGDVLILFKRYNAVYEETRSEIFGISAVSKYLLYCIAFACLVQGVMKND